MRPPLNKYYYFKNNPQLAMKKDSSDKRGITLKDVLIPFFSALIAVFFNQVFFENNRRIEAKIEYQKERLQQQTPILNRLLAFTYKYEILTRVIYTLPVQEITYIDKATNEVIRIEKRELREQMDSVVLTSFSFVSETDRRERLLNELKFIESNKDLLDHHIYQAIDDILSFLDKNKLPILNMNEDMVNSVWMKQETQDQWGNLLVRLRTITYQRMDAW